MKTMAVAAWRQFLLPFRHKRYALMMLVMLAMSWAGMDIYHNYTVFDLPVAVVDHDQSQISRTITRYLDASSLLAVTGAVPGSMEEARKMMIDGEICALIVIPDDFSTSIKKGRQGEVLVDMDMSNILTGRNASKAIAKVLGTVSAGINMKVLGKMGEPTDSQLARVMPLVSEDNYSFNPAANYAVYLAPGVILFLLHIYMILMTLAILRTGVTRREMAGAFGGLVLHTLLLGMVFLYVFLPRQGIYVQSGLPVVLAAFTIFLIHDVVLCIGVKMIFRRDVTVMQVSVFLGMLSLMFSGITWPSDMFPLPIQWFAWLLPFTPFAKGFRMFIHSSMSFEEMSGIFAAFGYQMAFYLSVIATLLIAFRIGSAILNRKERSA